MDLDLNPDDLPPHHAADNIDLDDTDVWEDVDVQPDETHHDDAQLSDSDISEPDLSHSPITPQSPLSPTDAPPATTAIQPLTEVEDGCVDLLRIANDTVLAMAVIETDDEPAHRQHITALIQLFYTTCLTIRHSLQHHITKQHTVRTYAANNHADNMQVNVARKRLSLLQQQLHTLQFAAKVNTAT